VTLDDLHLTPSQLAELNRLDAELVSAWLAATGAAGKLERPAGYFLTGVRSGNMPANLDDAVKRKQIHLAETYIRNAGCFLPTEAEFLDELFGYHGRLKAWAGDELLRRRMVDCWQAARPAAERTEREQLERAHRWRHGRPGERPDEPPSIPW
jgi:hypothetical protein